MPENRCGRNNRGKASNEEKCWSARERFNIQKGAQVWPWEMTAEVP